MPDAQTSLTIPDAPIIAVGQTTVAVLSPDGECDLIDHAAASRRLSAGQAAILCHGPASAARLGIERQPWFDLT